MIRAVAQERQRPFSARSYIDWGLRRVAEASRCGNPRSASWIADLCFYPGMDDASSHEVLADSTEMIIALVAAVGTDVTMICDLVATTLDEYDYRSQLFRLSDYLEEQARHS